MPNRETLEENRRIHRKHVHAWKESGKSLNQYARENGIHPRTFFDWCRKYGTARANNTGKDLRSPGVELVAVPIRALKPLVGGRDSAEKPLSIEFGKKFRIVVPPDFSPGLLGRVIKTLENVE